METSASQPPLKALERVMRETTERLAFECARPSTQAPHWSDFHWRIARAVTALHGVASLLSKRLRWQGPRAWCEFLEAQWHHTFNRHQGLTGLIAKVDSAARAADIGLVALKGVALHELAIYAPGERPMADLDLLVKERELAASSAMLATLGYLPSYSTRKEHVFSPPGPSRTAKLGEHAANALKIELHTRIAERLPLRESDITDLLLPERLEGGLHGYGSVEALMTHLLLHAAGDMRARSLRLIQLNDIAALAPRLGMDQWARVLGAERAARAWWAFPPLALTARYYPDLIAPEVLAGARAVCPRVLRSICQRQRLSDVSFSYLWVQFSPGIEWSRSLSEALEYAHSRIFPTAAVRAEIRQCENTQLWARDTAWSRLSRPRRVARWLVSRCPRDATMLPVRAALEAGALSDESI